MKIPQKISKLYNLKENNNYYCLILEIIYSYSPPQEYPRPKKISRLTLLEAMVWKCLIPWIFVGHRRVWLWRMTALRWPSAPHCLGPVFLQWGWRFIAPGEKQPRMAQETCPSILGAEGQHWLLCEALWHPGSVSGRADGKGHSDRLSWAVIRQWELPLASYNQ